MGTGPEETSVKKTTFLLSSLTQLLVMRLKNDPPRVDGNDESLELKSLFASCPNLYKLTVDTQSQDQAAALSPLLPVIITLKSFAIKASKILDQDLVLVLDGLPPGMADIGIYTEAIGAESLTAMTRFLHLKNLTLGDILYPTVISSQAVPTVLTHCHTLCTFAIRSAIDGTDLALGSPWVCDQLESFEVSIAGVSRAMTNPGLIEGDVPPEFWEQEPIG